MSGMGLVIARDPRVLGLVPGRDRLPGVTVCRRIDRRTAPNRPHAQAHAERKFLMHAMHSGGSTLKEIGAQFGITRERARQIVRPKGSGPKPTRQDPIKIVASIRRTANQTETARELGIGVGAVHAVVRELGMRPAINRLRRLRTRARLARGLADAAKELGYTPGKREMDAHASGLHAAGDYQRIFGSLSAAMKAAGLTPRTIGKKRNITHCKRGHELTSENTYSQTVRVRGREYRTRACTECKRACYRARHPRRRGVA